MESSESEYPVVFQQEIWTFHSELGFYSSASFSSSLGSEFRIGPCQCWLSPSSFGRLAVLEEESSGQVFCPFCRGSDVFSCLWLGETLFHTQVFPGFCSVGVQLRWPLHHWSCFLWPFHKLKFQVFSPLFWLVIGLS